MNSLFKAILDKVLSEPAVLIGAIASAVVFVSAHFGIVLDDASVQAVVAPFVSAALVRFAVVPVHKLKKGESDDEEV